MKVQNKGILVLVLALTISIFGTAGLADTLSASLDIKLEMYDEDMVMIGEITEAELRSSYSKYTYPLGTEYIRVIANTDDAADEIKITINGDKYQEYPHKDIADTQQCYIRITATDSTTEKESEFDIQLDRSAAARDNTITTLSWSIYDSNDNPLPTTDILLLDEGNTYILPNSVVQVSLDYFVTGNPFTIVSVILENGNVMIANDEPVMIDTSKDITTVYIQGQIDDSFITYSLTFEKATEASSDNKLTSIDIEGYSETDYFTPAVVQIIEGTLEYSAIISKEVTEFCVYSHASHVMADMQITAEGAEADENGVVFFPMEGASAVVTIDVTAENGDKQSYNISVLKEKENTGDSGIEEVEKKTGSNILQDNLWMFIAGGVILLAIGVMVFMQIRRNRY